MSSNKHYFTHLDASRFLAFIAVFLTHTFYSDSEVITHSGIYQFINTHLKLGNLALHYFFVLSSFLITWVILEEYKNTGQFNAVFFLIRRALRIWPLYFCMVLMGIVIVYIHPTSQQLPHLLYFFTFTLNIYIAFNGPDFLFFMVFLWSISVEEQFYIFWSFALKYYKKYILHISLLLILTSLVFRSYVNNDNQLMFNTLSSLSDFALGSIAAYMAFNKHKFITSLVNTPRLIIYTTDLLFALNIFFYQTIYSHKLLLIFENILFACFYVFFILEQSFFTNSFIKIGKWKSINYLGRISLGLYLYHGIIISILFIGLKKFGAVQSFLSVFVLVPIIAFASTIIVSILSHELFEKRITQLKNKFYPA